MTWHANALDTSQYGRAPPIPQQTTRRISVKYYDTMMCAQLLRCIHIAIEENDVFAHNLVRQQHSHRTKMLSVQDKEHRCLYPILRGQNKSYRETNKEKRTSHESINTQ